PPPRPGSPAAPPPRKTLTATPTAIATAAAREKRAKQQTVVMPPPGGAVRLAAKAVKASLVLDPAIVAEIERPDGAPAPPLVVAVDGRRLRAQVSAKGLRKVLAAIALHGPDSVVVILQGKLAEGDVLAEAGLVAQVKTPKAAA